MHRKAKQQIQCLTYGQLITKEESPIHSKAVREGFAGEAVADLSVNSESATGKRGRREGKQGCGERGQG